MWGIFCACVSTEAGQEIRKSGYIFCGELVQEASNFGRVKKPLNNNNNILTKNIPKRQKRRKGTEKSFSFFAFFSLEIFPLAPRGGRGGRRRVVFSLPSFFTLFVCQSNGGPLSSVISVGMGGREGLLAEIGCAVVGFGQQPVSYKWIFSSSSYFFSFLWGRKMREGEE